MTKFRQILQSTQTKITPFIINQNTNYNHKVITRAFATEFGEPRKKSDFQTNHVKEHYAVLKNTFTNHKSIFLTGEDANLYLTNISNICELLHIENPLFLYKKLDFNTCPNFGLSVCNQTHKMFKKNSNFPAGVDFGGYKRFFSFPQRFGVFVDRDVYKNLVMTPKEDVVFFHQGLQNHIQELHNLIGKTATEPVDDYKF